MSALSGNRTTILMYHSVSRARDAYSVTPETFRRHVQLIRDSYRVVALRDAFSRLNGENERQVVLTFDDAFVDFADHVYPVLSEMMIPATVFVPTGYIGLSSTWDQDNPEIRPKRIMSTEHLRALSADPLVDLGSHTVDHVSMRQLTEDDMRDQVLESRRSLEDVSGRPINMFSYPFGQRDDFSSETEDVLRRAGYEMAVTTCWGTRNSVRNGLRLRRIWLKEADDDSTVHAKINGNYDWIGVKELLGHTIRCWTGRSIRRPDHRAVTAGHGTRQKLITKSNH